MAEAYLDHRDAALALLNGKYPMTRQSAGFLGQLTVDARPLSEAQLNWLDRLLKKNGLPNYVQGADHGPSHQPGG
jgi:hypothetical protein